MQEERIRLTSTDSANSVNKDTFVDVELQRHTKVFPFPSVSNTIDQMELFESERADSTKYRLILTINPYCTNVLFNSVTEIVKNEGTDVRGDLYIASADGVYKATGTKDNSLPSNVDMVRNTEYANDGFEYHCGFDIFNNHILRNQSFKLVSALTENSHKYRNTIGGAEDNNYNTIRDIMRYADGSEVKLTRRTDVKTIEGVKEVKSQNNARHLYLKEDILSFIDGVSANISEQNGWYGFNNRSSIAACDFNNRTKQWDDMKISKVFNGEFFKGDETEEQMACKFVEMYPDSTLYSFNPKYNRFQNREEQNWDVCITYPYKTFGLDYNSEEERGKILINGSLQETDENDNAVFVNALLLASYKQTKGTSGQDIVLFRSFVKHNLKRGDKIKLYYNTDQSDNEGNFIEIKEREFNVTNIGNLSGDYLDYYFYINDVNDLKQVLGVNEEDNIEDNVYTFRFVKVINGRDCQYYYRKFRKLPNLRFKKEELTDEIVNNKGLFEQYIDENCRKTANSEMIPFGKEQYQLAFSRTIYDDANTQIVFTDTIDIDKFTDNLGRPLTELYVTFIKRNKGHDKWYKKKKTVNELKEIEFSHCFGEVRSGLDIHIENEDNEYLKNIRKEIGDCCMITNTDGKALDKNIVLEHNKSNEKDKDIFFGDVVELDRHNMTETVLADVHFRFNTEQREHEFTGEELNCGLFVFDEIETDDYDRDGFVCNENEVEYATYRPEGYHYKAHYPIKVREFGALRQGFHKEIKVASCRPRQANGMFIEVVSVLNSGVSSGDVVFLCDENEDMMIPLTVNSVQSNVRFLVNPMVYGSHNYKNVFEIVEGLLYSEVEVEEGQTWIDEYGNENIADSETAGTQKDYSKPKYKLKIKNNSIPPYALKVAVNTYLWRDVLNVGNKDAVELTEYPFANGHFYINKNINFFLERQDPFDHNDLYAKDQIPNDIFGNTRKQSNYVYKDEEHRIC